MEYCLSTVNEFLNDIRAFQKRASTRQSSGEFWSDSNDPDDEVQQNNLNSAKIVINYFNQFHLCSTKHVNYLK